MREGASANSTPATARATATAASVRPRSQAMVYSATTGPTTVSEKPRNALCSPRNVMSTNRNTGHGNRLRAASGSVVSASATNTDVSGTTFTMPRYWRNSRSGITMDEAVSMSCPQPNRNAASITATSTAQSLGAIGRLFTRKFSMSAMVRDPAPPRHTPTEVIGVSERAYREPGASPPPSAPRSSSTRSMSCWRVWTSSLA